MAFTAPVTTERAEYLIYTVFPVTISLWFVSSIVSEPFQFLAYIGVASSILTILLYELKIDDSLVRWYFSRVHGKQKASMEMSFVSWNILLRTWHKSVRDPPQLMTNGDTIERRVLKNTRNIVDSYAIRKRLWSIRGSFWLFLSIPFLLWTAVKYLRDTNFGSQISFLDVPFVGIDSTGLLVPTLTLSVVIWMFQVLANIHQHKDLRNDLKNLTIMRYVQRLVAYDALENPEKYAGGIDSERTNLQKELEFLDKVIVRDDWAIFIDRWVPIRRKTERRARLRFQRCFIDELMQNWMRHCVVDETGKRSQADILASARILAWNIHYLIEFLDNTKPRLGHHSESIVKFVRELYLEHTIAEWDISSESRSVLDNVSSFFRSESDEHEYAPITVRLLLQFMNPVYIATQAGKSLLDDYPRGNELPMKSFSNFVADKLLLYFIGKMSDDDLSKLRETKISEEMKSEGIADLIVELVSQCEENKNKTAIWRNITDEAQVAMLVALLEWSVGKTSSHKIILTNFFKEASTRARISFLRMKKWHSTLEESVSGFIEDILSEKFQYSENVRREMKELPFIRTSKENRE